jgi:hypothetical protein
MILKIILPDAQPRTRPLQIMRNKVQNKQYVNWHEVVRDFELICSNAMRYNQKRSRIHKVALVLLRGGKRLMKEMELEGRRAISVLHPAGPASLQPDDSMALPSSLLRSGEQGGWGLGAHMSCRLGWQGTLVVHQHQIFYVPLHCATSHIPLAHALHLLSWSGRRREHWRRASLRQPRAACAERLRCPRHRHHQ